MWRLWHKIFDWHYVIIQYGDALQIKRVRALPNGEMYVEIYGRVIYLSQYDLQWLALTWDVDQNPKT